METALVMRVSRSDEEVEKKRVTGICFGFGFRGWCRSLAT
jgi:hypothetical protein